MPKVLTAKNLRRADACASQVTLFEKYFGKGGKVTLAKCLAHADEFDWAWAASRLLSAPAQAAYEKATAPAQAAYEKATAPAQAAYEKAHASAQAAYEKATAPAWAAYDKAKASAQAAYEKARASAFYRGWNS